MLTSLMEWEESAASCAPEQSLSLVETLAAQETCPLPALDYTAALDWQPLEADGNEVDMARVQRFQLFVQAVKVIHVLHARPELALWRLAPLRPAFLPSIHPSRC